MKTENERILTNHDNLEFIGDRDINPPKWYKKAKCIKCRGVDCEFNQKNIFINEKAIYICRNCSNVKNEK